MSDLATLLGGGSFFEGPRWHDGRWWVSDFYRERVLTVDPSGRAAEVLRVPGQPSGLGWLPTAHCSLRIGMYRAQNAARIPPRKGLVRTRQAPPTTETARVRDRRRYIPIVSQA